MMLVPRLIVIFMILMATALPGRAIEISQETLRDGTRYLLLSGTFDHEDDEETLVEAAEAHSPEFVGFVSGGGNVYASMRFGRTIRALGLSTVQISAAPCASACSLAFLGGTDRYAQDEAIWVHQMSFSSSAGIDADTAVEWTQLSSADVMDYVAEMGVDPRMLTLGMRVGKEGMHRMTSEEMREYKVTTAEFDRMWDVPGHAVVDEAGARTSSRETDEVPPATAAAASALRSADRVAVYRGLDFMGRDIDATAENDVTACAGRCMSTSGCAAFTFNARTSPGAGPNCFLKNSRGYLDGNGAAVSGVLLKPLDPEPETLTFGVIDPTTSLEHDVDLPGYDLIPRPLASATTPLACRMACVNEGRCAAFTFVREGSRCWLKGRVGTPRAMPGAVSGRKTAGTYEPKVVGLR